jgi:hypothetical protein
MHVATHNLRYVPRLHQFFDLDMVRKELSVLCVCPRLPRLWSGWGSMTSEQRESVALPESLECMHDIRRHVSDDVEHGDEHQRRDLTNQSQ